MTTTSTTTSVIGAKSTVRQTTTTTTTVQPTVQTTVQPAGPTMSAEPHGRLSGGDKAGIAIGAVAGVLLIAAIASFIIMRRRKSQESPGETFPAQDPPEMKNLQYGPGPAPPNSPTPIDARYSQISPVPLGYGTPPPRHSYQHPNHELQYFNPPELSATPAPSVTSYLPYQYPRPLSLTVAGGLNPTSPGSVQQPLEMESPSERMSELPAVVTPPPLSPRLQAPRPQHPLSLTPGVRAEYDTRLMYRVINGAGLVHTLGIA
jgi:hypothetical protein